jgi:hypothetical protein
MAIFLDLLEGLRLGGRSLQDFARIEAARSRCRTLTQYVSRLDVLGGQGMGSPGELRFPDHGRGGEAAHLFLAQHYPDLRPDVPLLIQLWSIASDVPRETEEDLPSLGEVVEWANWELEYARNAPLLVVGTALAEVLTLAPLGRGNRQLAELWGTLMMLRSGFEYVALAPVGEFLPAKLSRLRACRERLAHERNLRALEYWMEALLDLLACQAETAMERLEARLSGPALPALQASLMALVRREGRITSRRAREVTQASRNTLKDNFRRLVEAGHLTRHGQRRGIFYTPAKVPPGPEGGTK